MSNYLAKVKYLGPTFVYVCWGTTLLLVLLRWLFAIHLKVISNSDGLWELVLPLLVAPPVVILFFIGRLSYIVYSKPKEKNGIYLVPIVAIFVMCVCAQKFVTFQIAEMRIVNVVEDIGKYPKVRYYQIRNYQLAQRANGMFINSQTYTSRSKPTQRVFDAYIGKPMMTDTTNFNVSSPPKYWCGLTYSVRFNDKIPSHEKAARYRVFAKNSWAQGQNFVNVERPDHFENFTGFSRGYYSDAIAKVVAVPYDLVLLRPVYELYKDRTGNLLPWVFGVFGIGLLVFAIALLSGEMAV